MTTYYVNKSGDDANDGLGPSTAFLTIQAGIDALTRGDTLIVQSGVYEENVSLASGLQNCTLQCDGYVVMDGINIGGTALDFGGGWNRTGAGDNPPIKNLIIRNYNMSWDGYNSCPYFQNCYLEGDLKVGGGRWQTFENCVIIGNFNVIFRAIERFWNCTVRGNYDASGLPYNAKSEWKNCDWDGEISYEDGFEIGAFYNNNFRTGPITYMGTTYTNISNFYAAYPTLTDGSFSETPDMNPDYTLKWVSPNIGSGEGGSNVGARGPAHYYTSSDDLFANVVLSNVVENANGNYELEAGKTTGTILTAVMDFGEDITVEDIRWTTEEQYPDKVADSDNSDIEPNRREIEYRSHTEVDGSFTQTADIPAWSEHERDQSLNITCRYLQFRITLRGNGVAT